MLGEMEMADITPPIELDLRGNPGLVKFTTVEDVEAWATEEEQFWSQMPAPTLRGGPFSAFEEQLSRIRSLVSTAKQRAQSDWRTPIDNLLRRYYLQWDVVHSSTVWAQHIMALAKRDPNEGTVQLWVVREWQKQKVGASIQNWSSDGNYFGYAGLIAAAFARIASWTSTSATDDASAREAALTKVQSDLVAAQSKWQEAMHSAELAGAELNKRFSQTSDEQTKQHEALLKKHHQELIEFVARANDKIKALEALFNQKIQLEAPVAYWRTKASVHWWAAFRWGVGAIAAILLPVGLFLGFSRELLNWLVANNEKIGTHGLALLLIVAVFYLSFCRLVVRQYNTNRSLENDASERVVMAETFLALVQDKKIKDEERALVLAPLFRPHGVTGADEGAAGLADALGKALTSPKP